MKLKKNDKDFILKAIKKDGWLLEEASKRLRDDKEVVMESIKQSGWALKYASERLRDEKEVVLEAIKQDGYALNFASERLQDDKELLELLENTNFLNDIFYVHNFYDDKKKWYQERMEFLNNIREKELLHILIKPSNKQAKKIKF